MIPINIETIQCNLFNPNNKIKATGEMMLKVNTDDDYISYICLKGIEYIDITPSLILEALKECDEDILAYIFEVGYFILDNRPIKVDQDSMDSINFDKQ